MLGADDVLGSAGLGVHFRPCDFPFLTERHERFAESLTCFRWTFPYSFRRSIPRLADTLHGCRMFLLIDELQGVGF
jgi:hypothetical protein